MAHPRPELRLLSPPQWIIGSFTGCYNRDTLRRSYDTVTHPDLAAPKFFGASVRRIEDPRFLLGQARYVGDLHGAGALHATFVRSPHAHAHVRDIDVSAAMAVPGCVRSLLRAISRSRVAPIRATSNYPGFMETDYPVLAEDKGALRG